MMGSGTLSVDYNAKIIIVSATSLHTS